MAWEGTSYYIPNSRENTLTAYTNGPVTLGTRPSPTARYTGSWAVCYSPSVGHVQLQSVGYIGQSIASYSVGNSLGFFDNFVNNRNPSNLSATFDNSGQIFVGVESDLTNPPTISVAGSSGAFTASWTGYNPLVFNGVQIGTGFYSTGLLNIGQFYSGAIGCLYNHEPNGTGLFVRYAADSFSTESAFSLSGVTGYFLWVAGMCPAFFADPVG